MDIVKLLPDVPIHKIVPIPIAPIHTILVLPKINAKKETHFSVSNEDVKKHNASLMKAREERLAIEKNLEDKLSKVRKQYYNI